MYHIAREGYEKARSLARRSVHGQGSVRVNRCIPWRLDGQLARAGLRKLDGRVCNFIFFPLHETLPRASLALNRRLAPLSGSPLGLFFGAQYVVKIEKRG